MIWSCFNVVVYAAEKRRVSSSWTSLTVLGPRRHSTRRMASSASVGRGSSGMTGRYTKSVVLVNDEFRRSSLSYNPPPMLKPGDRVTHRFHAELGPGRVLDVQGRSLRVEFPDARQTLSFAVNTDALVPLTVTPGGRARLEPSGEMVVVESCEGGRCLLADGRDVALDHLWPLPAEISPVERLARGNVDAFEDFANRLDGLRLLRERRAGGLGSFLGGRIQLFPHQLYAAERAC